jgi:hypothetical protein
MAEFMVSCVVRERLSVSFVAAAVLSVLLGASEVRSADNDLQSWFPLQFVHPFDEKWTGSMQAELRLKDDISEFSD